MTESAVPTANEHRRLTPVMMAVAWTLLLLLLGFLVVPPSWRDTDDVRMAMIASGIGSTDGASEFLLYTNILIGCTLKLLYERMPDVSWYGLYLITIQSVAHACLAWSIISIRPGKAVMLALAVVHVSIFLYFWVNLQFTGTSALSALAGTTVLARAMLTDYECGRFPLKMTLGGWGLIILSSLVRYHSCGLICILSAPMLAMMLIRLKQPLRIVNHAAAGAIGLTVLFGCAELNRLAYDEHPDWREFLQMQSPMAILANNIHLRMDFLDSADSAQNTNKQNSVLQRAGLTRNDLNCIFDWLYFDETVFSTERFTQASTELHPSPLTLSTCIQTYYLLSTTMFKDRQFLIVVILSLALLFRQNVSGWQLWGTVFIWLYTLIVLWGIAANMKLPPRVYVPATCVPLLSTIILALLRSREQSSESPMPNDPPVLKTRSELFGQAGLLIVCLLAASTLHERFQFSHQVADKRKSVEAELANLIETNTFCVVTVVFPFELLSPLDSLDWARGWQFIYLDGHMRTPRQKAIIKQTGFSSITEAMTSSSELLLVSSTQRKLDLLTTFFAEKYDTQIEFQTQDRMRWFRTFRIKAAHIHQTP